MNSKVTLGWTVRRTGGLGQRYWLGLRKDHNPPGRYWSACANRLEAGVWSTRKRALAALTEANKHLWLQDNDWRICRVYPTIK